MTLIISLECPDCGECFTEYEQALRHSYECKKN